MYVDPREKVDLEIFSKPKKSLQFNQIADYKKMTMFINKIKPQKGKLLEVGSNVGVFL